MPVVHSLKRRNFTQLHNAFSSLESLESRQLLSNTYVVAPGGNDSGAGDAAHPWATIDHATEVVGVGDTVDVKAGTYQGFQETTSGTANAPIVFHAESGVVINDRNWATQDGINLESASYITIDGFTVQPKAGVTMRAGIRSVANTGVVIKNNTVDHASWWGILTGFSENVDIENNITRNTQIQHGIYVGNSADNPIIRNNISYDNRYCGIQINADGSQGGDGIITNALVEGNILYGNNQGGGAAINLDGVSSSKIDNNLIYNNARNGIALYQIDGNAPDTNNLIVNNTIVEQPGQGYYAISIIGGATQGSTGNQVFNNILFSQRGSIQLSSDSYAGFKSDNNIVQDKFNLEWDESLPTDFSGWKSTLKTDAHSILVTDPSTLFVNSANGDFHLANNSAAIGAGAVGVAPATDLEGNARNAAGPLDIGAYAFNGTPPVKPVAPNAPLNLQAGGQTTSAITLKWTDGGGNETGFKVMRQNADISFSQVGNVMIGSPATFTDTQLSAGTGYTYEVIATGPGGDSGASNMVTTGTTALPVAPGAPASLISTAQTTSTIVLSWTDGGGNETGFKIMRHGASGGYTQVGSVAAGSPTTFTDKNLAADTPYTYEIVATGPGVDSLPSNELTVSTAATPIAVPPVPNPTEPTAPTELVAKATGTAKITLTWTDTANDETGFAIERLASDGTYHVIAHVGAKTRSFTNRYLTSGTPYSYEVIALNQTEQSDPSNPASAITLVKPAAPVSLTTNVINAGEIDLSWINKATSATSVNVLRRTDHTNYVVIKTLGSSATFYADMSVSANTQYYYRVMAFNGVGSNWSNRSTATTPA